MAGVVNFRDLQIWQKSMDQCVATYSVSKLLPKDELCGLASQMRRSSVSVPSNIAEGFARQGATFAQHLKIAQGSLKELETQLLICQRLDLLSEGKFVPLHQLCDEIGRMVRSFSRTIAT
ncbi:MAG TPA: four helix bundle protein [Hyphomicrobiaceae bacterium]|nr:four helix bundle protein [Hyphomicrobiaceae bacterium]